MNCCHRSVITDGNRTNSSENKFNTDKNHACSDKMATGFYYRYYSLKKSCTCNHSSRTLSALSFKHVGLTAFFYY